MLRGNLFKQFKGTTFFRTAEMPIANEIAMPADIHSIHAPPLLGGITDIQDLITAMNQLPVMVRGTASGKIAGQWYRVTFPRRVEEPHVVCTGMARAGDYITAEISRVAKPSRREILRASSPSQLDIPNEPRSEIPPISLKTPTEQNLANECYTRLRDGCIDATPGWNWWPISVIRDSVCSLFAAIGTVLGIFIYWFWKNFIKPDRDALKKGINDSVNLLYTKLWNQIGRATSTTQENVNRLYNVETIDQINKVRDSIELSIADLHNSTNSQVNMVRDRVNDVIRNLYQMWGVPVGYILTPIHIRNITPTGFEFQSFGDTTIQFIAVGSEEGA